MFAEELHTQVVSTSGSGSDDRGERVKMGCAARKVGQGTVVGRSTCCKFFPQQTDSGRCFKGRPSTFHGRLSEMSFHSRVKLKGL